MITKEARRSILNLLKKAIDDYTPHTDATIWLALADFTPTDDMTASEWFTNVGNVVQAGNLADIFTTDAAIISGQPSLQGLETSWLNDTGSAVTVYGWIGYQPGPFGDQAEMMVGCRRFATPVTVPDGVTFKLTPRIICQLPA